MNRLLCVLTLSLVAGCSFVSAGNCSNLEDRVRLWISMATCPSGDWGDRDNLECNNAARGLWLREYGLVHAQAEGDACVFLFHRSCKTGWAAIGQDGQVFVFLGSDVEERLVVIASYSLAAAFIDSSKGIETSDEAIRWTQEILHAAMAPKVLMSGHPLGRPFFDDQGKLPCDSEYDRDMGYCVVEGSPMRAVRHGDRWSVTVEEWRCETHAAFEWQFDMRSDGTLVDVPVIQRKRDAEGCDVGLPLSSSDGESQTLPGDAREGDSSPRSDEAGGSQPS